MIELLKAVDGRIPNFAGIKYTFESLYEYNQCRLYKDGKFDMLHGQDETIPPRWHKAEHRAASAAPPTTTAASSPASSKHGRKGDIETAREKQNFSQAVIQRHLQLPRQISWAESAS